MSQIMSQCGIAILNLGWGERVQIPTQTGAHWIT